MEGKEEGRDREEKNPTEGGTEGGTGYDGGGGVASTMLGGGVKRESDATLPPLSPPLHLLRTAARASVYFVCVRAHARARACACVCVRACVLHLAASTAPPHSPPPAVTTPRPLLPARPASQPAPVRAGRSPPSLCQFLLGPFPAPPRPAASRGQLRRFTPPSAAAAHAHRPAHAHTTENFI